MNTTVSGLWGQCVNQATLPRYTDKDKKELLNLIIFVKLMKKETHERIWNFPNFITFTRIIITFLILYLIIGRYPIIYIAISFIAGMLTDFLDGQVARRLHLTTEFGRKFDIIADRFLMISTVGGLIFYYSSFGLLGHWRMIEIFMIMSREILSFPFALILLISGLDIPHAKFIGKVTTLLQGFAFPSIILSIYVPFFFYVAIVLSIATCIVGIFSAATFVRDFKALQEAKI